MSTKHPIVNIAMKGGGTMRIELYPEKAPITVDNFIALVESGYYNGLIFHRVIKDFMIQGGSGDGTSVGTDEGFTIKGEFAANGVDTGLRHQRGAVSMARSSFPDSASTQFFIVHQDADYLDGQYASFGKLVEGLEELDRIASDPTASLSRENRPDEPQVMESVTVDLQGYEPQPPRRITTDNE